MTITVIGATGQQGSAVIDALIDRNASVRAVTRNPHSDNATKLSQRGVEVVAADLNDVASVRDALDGAQSAFAMTTYDGPAGTEGEIGQGRTIAEAVKSAGVSRFVYSSVGGAERHTGIPHFESKARIEEFLLGAGRVKFVRPTFFMENFARLIRRDDDRVMVAMPLPDGVPLQMISVRDIGKVAAALLLDEASSIQAVEIAGDELTGSQIAERVGAHLGLPAAYKEAPLDVLGEDEDRKKMFQWFTRRPAYQADFDATRQLVPDVEDFATWLRQNY
ncbi:NmrA/HSCARG family protein [Mycolicibacterium stellerae]|uniref:NmrA/HSCARG family protein n=1 Tax=Mycolicibacterium stellerae TaxID=2358193 RepID=UPI000F0BD414|nr:NmrA/HSCARG family protein [Mycolicibacterium stellerae]